MQVRDQGVGVRVHAEAGEAGLCVWLGIAEDAERVLVRSKPLLEALRRHAHASGQRLAAVVCNGQPILDASAPTHPSILQRDIP